MSTHLNSDELLELFLEAARRANWDALHGPRHLRSGRYHPESAANVQVQSGTAKQEPAADAGDVTEED